jgi:hypothetical protein
MASNSSSVNKIYNERGYNIVVAYVWCICYQWMHNYWDNNNWKNTSLWIVSTTGKCFTRQMFCNFRPKGKRQFKLMYHDTLLCIALWIKK